MNFDIYLVKSYELLMSRKTRGFTHVMNFKQSNNHILCDKYVELKRENAKITRLEKFFFPPEKLLP